ncbi:P17/29C-like protein DDB_G0287399 [Cephus cinctus]|uniref:P17/29C-like protein DDB_G0287399 n=1 Tax=Cephus cinctus TaxID=211228 RepID=A0AAJ7FNU4_CEPCN|nr:P17/29C-like protein DDB_G0287399 [Cephus cinctus]
MAKCTVKIIFCVLSVTWIISYADDRIHFNEEDERRWNTPPELTPEPAGKGRLKDSSPQARFLPFSATFSLSAGDRNSHSLTLGGNRDGLSLSQSASQAEGSLVNGGSALSASQSASFSAGLSGISAADSNAFNLNHPLFGGTSEANSNSFSIGDANASSHGKVENGQAVSGAQSSVGNSASGAASGAQSAAGNGQASSGAESTAFQNAGHGQGRPTWTNIGPNYEVHDFGHHRRPSSVPSNNPTFVTGQRPQKWVANNHRGPIRLEVEPNGRWENRRPEIHVLNHGQRGPRPGRPVWPVRNCGNSESRRQASNSKFGNYYDSNSACGNNLANERPEVQISAASASSGASSMGNGFSFSQSSSQSQNGPNGPFSSTSNQVQTSGNAQGFSQGASAALGQNANGQTDASFSSSAISGSSQGNGQSVGSAASGNRGESSRGQVNNQASGIGMVHGTANAGSVSFVRFPAERNQDIPREFVRSQPARDNQENRAKKKNRNPIDTIITEISDSVAELFDI